MTAFTETIVSFAARCFSQTFHKLRMFQARRRK